MVAARTTSSSGLFNIDLTQRIYSLKAPNPICNLNKRKNFFLNFLEIKFFYRFAQSLASGLSILIISL
jgi:hypothetical protein